MTYSVLKKNESTDFLIIMLEANKYTGGGFTDNLLVTYQIVYLSPADLKFPIDKIGKMLMKKILWANYGRLQLCSLFLYE